MQRNLKHLVNDSVYNYLMLMSSLLRRANNKKPVEVFIFLPKEG
jgi:hypothetical protein